MIVARALRSTAVALAVAAIVDPSVPLPRQQRPGVRVIGGEDAAAVRDLVERLDAAGFPAAADREAATVVVPGRREAVGRPAGPTYVVSRDAAGPDVSIVRAWAARSRVAGQAVIVNVSVRGHGAPGRTSELTLEDAGLAVASARHQWTAADEAWQTTMAYLPGSADALRLRVRADVLPGEHHVEDNVADVLAPPERGPIRTLVIESGVTWPGVFVRRVLEAEPGFAVATLQRASKGIAARSGSPPAVLTRRDLAAYEVILLGRPDELTAQELDAVRWFVEDRGGVALFLPDQLPKDRRRELIGDVAFEPRLLERPVVLRAAGMSLEASELAIPHLLPPFAEALATDPDGAPVVFALRRGMGAVIVSGALDAWRYREMNDGAFARFWPAVVLAQAATVPPLMEVTAEPPLARPGDVVHLTVRLRPTELPANVDGFDIPLASARAVTANRARAQLAQISRGNELSETLIRLWPGSAPGVYEGEWRADTAGTYALDVAIGDTSGAAVVQVAADVTGQPVGEGALAIAAGVSGGAVVADGSSLVRALQARFPARMIFRPSNPTRSPWWAAAFAAALSGEWALRRRRGRP